MCSICEHENRVDIDRAIVAGDSYTTLIKKWGISSRSIAFHKKECMQRTGAALIAFTSMKVEGKVDGGYETTPQLLDTAALQKAAYVRLMGIADKVEGRVDACIAKGEDRNLAPLVQSLIRSIESALGRSQGGVVNNFIAGDIRQSAEWKAMMRLTKQHPELNDELLSYLQ